MSQSIFCAVVGEYLAIALQATGMRGAARYLRAYSLRRSTSGIHPSCEPGALPPLSNTCMRQNCENAPLLSPAPGGSAGKSSADRQRAVDPFVIDTATERRLQFTGDALQSRMRLDDPYALVSAYTRQMMSFLLFNPDPAHILMIGLGGGALAKFCYRRLPRAQITVVEIDARVIALRESFHVPPDDSRFRVIHDDGAHYMARLDAPVDVILVDAFDAGGVAPSLATANFFDEASRHLTPGGVLIMNLYGKPQRYAALVRKLRDAIGHRALLARTINDNVLLFGFKPDVIAPSARQLDTRARYLQSRFQLQFPSYLQRIRDGRGVEES